MLFGAEVGAPIVTPKARDLNFTNEGGVCGTTRLLKNTADVVLQACMRWAATGQKLTYEELLTAADDDRLAFKSFFDPDHSAFFNPPNMAWRLVEVCRQTGQPPASRCFCPRHSR